MRLTVARLAQKLELTLGLVKPDVASKPEVVKAIREAIIKKNFYFANTRMLTLSQADAESFYGEHKGKFFFPELIAFMTSGPIFAHVLARDNAIKEWRALMGPTKPSQARKDAPQTLRAQFGTEDTFNAVHGSDSPMSAAREVGFYFPDFNVDEWFVKQEPAFAKGEVSFDEKTCIHVPK